MFSRYEVEAQRAPQEGILIFLGPWGHSVGTVCWGSGSLHLAHQPVSWDTQTANLSFLTVRLGVKVLNPPVPHPAVSKVAVITAIIGSVTVKIK